MLKAKIQEDINTAMKSRESGKVDALRLLFSEIKNEEINTRAELDDIRVMALIKKHVKKLGEAMEMFRKGNREDLAKANEDEIAIVSVYLPQEMNDDELKSHILRILDENAQLRAEKPQALIGIAMKELSGQVDPQRIMTMLKSLS